MIDVKEYKRLAREAGACQDIELDILSEMLDSWARSPGEPYTLLELRDGKALAGFALFFREPGTECSFSVAAFCVDRALLGSAAASTLLAMVEEEVQKLEGSALVRFEASTAKLAAMGESLLAGSGYSLIGHIPDFYAKGDDYYMYARHVSAIGPGRGEGGTT